MNISEAVAHILDIPIGLLTGITINIQLTELPRVVTPAVRSQVEHQTLYKLTVSRPDWRLEPLNAEIYIRHSLLENCLDLDAFKKRMRGLLESNFRRALERR